MSEYNPFAAPDVAFDSQFQPEGREYGGLRRLPYFGYGFLMNLVIQGIQAVGAAAESAPIVLATIPFALAGTIALAYQRCKNLGMNPWWSLALFVPILNIFVGLRCLAFPEGYQDHRTLDGPAKVLIGLFVAAILLIIVVVIFAVVAGGR